MKLHSPDFSELESLDQKTVKAIKRYQNLLGALNKHELPDPLVEEINAITDNLSAYREEKALRKQLGQATSTAINAARKQAGLITKGFYQSIWMTVGMAAFGIPFGVAFGLLLDNMALMAIGLPLGLPIGLAIGVALDKNAERAGKVLSLDY
jgi:hypothetical protein